MEATNHLVVIPAKKNITRSFSNITRKAVFRQDYVNSSKMKMCPYFTMVLKRLNDTLQYISKAFGFGLLKLTLTPSLSLVDATLGRLVIDVVVPSGGVIDACLLVAHHASCPARHGTSAPEI